MNISARGRRRFDIKVEIKPINNKFTIFENKMQKKYPKNTQDVESTEPLSRKSPPGLLVLFYFMIYFRYNTFLFPGIITPSGLIL